MGKRIEADQQKLSEGKKGCTEHDGQDAVVVAWVISNRDPGASSIPHLPHNGKVPTKRRSNYNSIGSNDLIDSGFLYWRIREIISIFLKKILIHNIKINVLYKRMKVTL